jgi:ribulose-phosphate 3-epimerase
LGFRRHYCRSRFGTSNECKSWFWWTKIYRKHLQKIRETKELILENNSTALIEIDGGVNTDNAPKLFEAGADVLVAGNAVFSQRN